MANLARSLAARGAQVTILTARWVSTWPAEITVGGVHVVRLPQPEHRVLGTARYMLELGRWLRRHEGEYDLVYVSMLKHDAAATLWAVGKRVPVVVRAEGAGLSGDCHWQRTDRWGWLIRRACRRASALVAPSQTIFRELIDAGYPPDRIHELPNGVFVPPPRSPGERGIARAALAEAHPSLFVPPAAPLALYTGRLHPAKGLDCLLAAWKAVVARWPTARLWIAGEGPHQAALESQINAMGLHGRAVLVGAFDFVDDLLAASDVFVLPSFEEGMSLALLEAMAAGLPVVATDIAGNRRLVEDGREGLLVPPDNASALADALCRILADPDLGVGLAAAACRRVETDFSLTKMVDHHVALFEQVKRR
jgi:glycosyltransferase involved in cell wall biosynthesis